jgi:hypothetical protein
MQERQKQERHLWKESCKYECHGNHWRRNQERHTFLSSSLPQEPRHATLLFHLLGRKYAKSQGSDSGEKLSLACVFSSPLSSVIRPPSPFGRWWYGSPPTPSLPWISQHLFLYLIGRMAGQTNATGLFLVRAWGTPQKFPIVAYGLSCLLPHKTWKRLKSRHWFYATTPLKCFALLIL